MNITIENSWRNTSGLWQDPDLLRVKNSPLSYRPLPIRAEECLKPLILTLRGPRRAGKTVTLKLLIAELIEKYGVPANEILWTSLETFRTLGQMEAHLSMLREKFNPRILFIDEVTSVMGWQKVIKKFRDQGVFAETCLVLTGSSAYDLKAGAERMAGRRGGLDHYDRVLLPMSYAEFFRQTSGSFEDYCAVGGFPFRVEEYLRTKNQNKIWDPFTGSAILDEVFFYEINRRKLSRSIALEVLSRLSVVKTSASSYEAFAKALSVTKDTLRKYLEVLGESFLLATISSYDTAKSRVAPKKDKKFIWIDPAFGYFAAWTRQGEVLDSATQAEHAVGIELLRRYEARLWEGIAAPRNVFTWKSKSGNEIDYLVVDRSQKLLAPFEVKFQNSISDWDFQVLEKSFGQGLILTKSTEKIHSRSKATTIEKWLLNTAPSPTSEP